MKKKNLTKCLILSMLCLFFVHCKKSSSTPGGVNSDQKQAASFPNELRPGLILRYNGGGEKDKLIVYVDSIDKSKGQCTIQYLYLSGQEEKFYFYQTRIVPLDNFKYSHKISHSFSSQGGSVENMGSMNTFFGSEEIINELLTSRETTFSVETNNSVTGLLKTDLKPQKLLYNGEETSIPSIQAKTGPLNSRFHKSFPIWFHNQPNFPLLLRYSQDILSSLDDVDRIAALLRNTLESKKSLLTGSLYFAIYNLSGSPTRRELMTISKRLWTQGILPVVSKNKTQKLIVEIFPVKNGIASQAISKNKDLKQVIQNLQTFLAATLSPEQLFVREGTRTDNFPEETSPIGSDPEYRVLIRLE